MIKNRRLTMTLLTGAVTASLMLVGCGAGGASAQEKNYRETGITQMESGQYSAAVKSFDRALDEAGSRSGDLEEDITYYKALAQFKNGDISQAVATYTQMIKADGDNYKPYYLRGCAYLKETDKLQAALSDFDKAVSLNKDDYDICINIYSALKEANEQESGRKYLNTALKIDGTGADDYAKKGYVEYLAGNSSQARKDLNRAIDKDSDVGLHYMGIMQGEENRISSSTGYFDRYLNAHKNDADDVMTLASAAVRCGNAQAGVRYYQKAVDLSGSDSQEAQRGLISAYEHTGNFSRAYTLLQKYMKSYPNDAGAKKEMAFVKTRLDSFSAPSSGSSADSTDSGSVN